MVTSDPVTAVPGVGPSYQHILHRLEINTVNDLINHFPKKYLDFSRPTNIRNLKPYSLFCLKATIVSGQSLRTRTGKSMQKFVIRDHTGTLTLTWFNQPFLQNTLKPGDTYYFVGSTKESTYFVTPILHEPATEKTLHTNRIVPFHPLTHGLSGKWLRQKIHLCLSSFDIPESLPTHIIQGNSLSSLSDAYQHIHFPQNPNELAVSQTRFAFNELLTLHLRLQKTRQAWMRLPAPSINIDRSLHQKFIASLPFTPTLDQDKAIRQTFRDLSRDYPSNRLIQGDVGSGKTLVAMAAALQTIRSGLHVLVIAPTRILASQHLHTFTQFLNPFSIQPGLITSGSNPSSSSTPLLIGTHALLSRKSKLDLSHIGLVVFDEQQRFGVLQRNFFVDHNHTPHHLTLSATPIPRTIALGLVGHLNLSNIKTLPQLKKTVKTWLVPDTKRTSAYSWIQKQITTQHIQAFFVCPAINPDETDSDAGSIKSAIQLHQHLQHKIFPKLQIGLLHGKLSKQDQQTVIQDYQNHKIDILVSTTVIEVGIDIKNANIMVIESADHFGLSQLHQLRGRVGRGADQGYCLLFSSDAADTDQINRLKVLETTHDGFTLSRLDLKLRGSGNLFDTRQSGHLNTQLNAFWDKSLSQKAKAAAADLLAHHPTHPQVITTSPVVNLQT